MTNDKYLIIVVGSGRSGTHLLGNLVGTSKQVTASIEDRELFPLITKAATTNDRELIPAISDKLDTRLKNCTTKFYLEKSHPLLWMAEDSSLAKLPIKYIGINRDPYATVASMLKHYYVRRWCENWDKLPQPNIFLGTSQDNLQDYKKMTIAQKCTMRWISHNKELERLSYIFPKEQYLRLRYEDVLNNTKQSVGKIEEFLGIGDIDKKFKMNKESLRKWKKDLTSEQKKQIDSTVKQYYGNES